MTKSTKLLILGFGGHARSVADVALACGYRELLFIDHNARMNEAFAGFPVLKHIPEELSGWEGFPASGNGRTREAQCEAIRRAGLALATLVAPSATLGPECLVYAGCFVGHHAHIGPAARLGTGCIVNTGAIIEHECVVGDFSHVSVNSTMAGRSQLGSHSMLGAGAVLIDGIVVADHVTIGAGGVVHRALDQPGTYAGVPVTRLA